MFGSIGDRLRRVFDHRRWCWFTPQDYGTSFKRLGVVHSAGKILQRHTHES
uniref:Uncharacterized protein n=1 Tax=Desmonostoc muscorum LEGE 12446 TaxID=1828758 RepID=A0A8J7DGJ7_DESMC